jgi:hypothetical protein
MGNCATAIRKSKKVTPTTSTSLDLDHGTVNTRSHVQVITPVTPPASPRNGELQPDRHRQLLLSEYYLLLQRNRAQTQVDSRQDEGPQMNPHRIHYSSRDRLSATPENYLEL